jgi:dTDP-glucose 4,6-dehydratase
MQIRHGGTVSYPHALQVAGRNAESLISFVKDRLGHDRHYAINAAKITSELNYSPNESFNTGINKTLTWYLQNEPWRRRIMDGSYREWVKINAALQTQLP